MESPLNTACELFKEAQAKDELRIIGGLAIQLLVGEVARTTHDVDIVPMSEETRGQLLERLERAGFRIGKSGGWWRAVHPDAQRILIDVAPHPIVNPRTFETICLRAPPVAYRCGNQMLRLAGPNDLAVLKLAAMRDQDLVDLMLLSRLGLDASAVARAAQDDDIERSIAAGAHHARQALGAGWAKEIFEQMLGREPSVAETQAFDEFLKQLERIGL